MPCGGKLTWVMVHSGRIFCVSVLLNFLCIFLATDSHAQSNKNIQVKVFDVDGNPMSNIELSIDNIVTVKTRRNGVVFTSIPETNWIPRDIQLADRTLTVESYKGAGAILEIIVRKRTHRKVAISIIDRATNSSLPDLTFSTQLSDLNTVTSDITGTIYLNIPIEMSLDVDGFFIAPEGYQIVDKRFSFDSGIIGVEKIVVEEPEVEDEEVQQVTQRPTRTTQPKPIEAKEPELTLTIERVDSISSLTVLYSLITKVDFNEMDAASKQKLDEKFKQLTRLNTISSILTVPSTPINQLINDTTIINDDVLTLIERMESESSQLDQHRNDFEQATKQIKDKLVNGGANLSEEERSVLIKMIMNLKDLLRRNEEKFYRNNTYYQEQIAGLQEQLVKILELEDKLLESEEARKKAREQLITAVLIAVALVGVVILLIFLTRLFVTQRNELSRVNKEIESINNNLEGLVAEKTESLAEINEELDTFLYRSSHNLRRPLTSIKGLASVAEMSLKDDLGLFDKVLQTSIEMEKMVDKLSMMNHINKPTDLQIIDIEGIFANAEAKFAEQIETSKITIDRKIQKKLEFNSFPIIIDLIIQNLFENAIFYSKLTKSGEPQIGIRVKKKADSNTLQIAIRDNGSGIDPNNIEKIWNMFYKGDQLSTGNGLGLYITKKAVESLDGTIKIDTKLGEYSLFVVELPYVEVEETKKEELVEETVAE